MSRSGYSDECDHFNLYRATVDRAIAGKRGQKFLREMAAAMDAMPEKQLIPWKLIRDDGAVCAIGSVCQARGMDTSKVNDEEPACVGKFVGIATCLAAEIAYINDDDFCEEWRSRERETPEHRWLRVRRWVEEKIVSQEGELR